MTQPEYRVHIIGSDYRDPLSQSVAFWVVRTHDHAVLDPIGVWEQQVEGAPIAIPSFRIPTEAVEALVSALDAMRGQPSHAKTEAAVLREWLEYERGRVDKVFEAVGRPIVFDPGPPVFKDKQA
jgi:hypothetical protein